MCASTLFAQSLQKTHGWLKEISSQAGWEERLGWEDQNRALVLLRAVLHQLRDNLPVENLANLSAQMPLILRGILFENWVPSQCPIKDRKLDIFLEGVEEQLSAYPDIDVERGVEVVFQTLAKHLSAGEVEKIGKVLPKSLQKFWKYSQLTFNI